MPTGAVRFAFARSLLNVCHRSLSRDELADASDDEANLLSVAIEKLRDVYDEFDLLAMSLRLSSEK